jgi:hypothetical protein
MDSFASFFIWLFIFGPLIARIHLLRAGGFRVFEFFERLGLPFPICASTLATTAFFASTILHGLMGAIIVAKLYVSQNFIMLLFLWMLSTTLDLYTTTELFADGDSDGGRRFERRAHHSKRVVVLTFIQFLLGGTFTALLYQSAMSLAPFLSFLMLHRLWELGLSIWILLFVCGSRRR